MSKEKSDKKEKKEKKVSDDGVKKEKKEKKDKKRKSLDAATAAVEDDAAVVAVDADGDVIVDLQPSAAGAIPAAALVPFANPLADDKNGKKVLKTVKKGKFTVAGTVTGVKSRLA